MNDGAVGRVMQALREAHAFSLAGELSWEDRLLAITGPVLAAVGQGDGGGEGEGGGEGAAAGGEGEGGGAAPPDLESLFSGFRAEVMSKFDGLEERLPADKFEGEGEGEGGGVAPPTPPQIFDPSQFTDEDYNEDGFLTREAQDRAMRGEIERQVAQALAPERERAAAERRTEAAEKLEKTYPIFADPEARAPVLAAAKQAAQKIANSQGNPELAQMWREPDFLETVYLGIVGRQAAERETPAGGDGSEVTLEHGGSAGPGAGGDGNGKEAAARIVAVGAKQKFRLG